MAPTARAEAAHLIDAPAALVYDILADYREHHPHILPKPAFQSLHVDKGGKGAGTEITVVMRVMGSRSTLRMLVSEPSPGRVLQETDVESGAVTTFTVDPRDGGRRCHVTIATEWPARPGFRGWLARALSPRVAQPLYEEELRKLDAYAQRLREPTMGAAGW